MEKTCSTCQKSKPLEDFHRSTRAKDGCQNRCKLCANDRSYKPRGPHSLRQLRVVLNRRYTAKEAAQLTGWSYSVVLTRRKSQWNGS